jgi:hypothetical protein
MDSFVRTYKFIRVTGRGGLCGYEILRIQYFIDNRLTDGGEVYSLKLWPRTTPKESFIFCFRY